MIKVSDIFGPAHRYVVAGLYCADDYICTLSAI